MAATHATRIAALAIAAAFFATSPRVVAAPADQSASLPAFVDLEVADTVVETDLVRSWATEAIVHGLTEADVGNDASTSRRLNVSIAGAPFDYDVTVGVKDGDDWIGDMRRGQCRCDDEQLVRKVRDDVLAVAGSLRSEPVGEPSTEPSSGPPPDTAPPVERTESAKLAAKGKAGVALIVIGASAVVAGAVLLGVQPKDEVDGGDSSRVQSRNNTPAGAAVLASGGVVLVIGAVLLGLDRRDARRRRSVHVGPTLGPTTWGAALTGRF